MNQARTTLMTHTLSVDRFTLQDTQSLDNRLKSFWDLESFGTTGPDCSVLEEFQDKIHFADGRYEVSLPWKDTQQLLPDNYQLNLRRLQGLLRLRQNRVLIEYNALIRNQI